MFFKTNLSFNTFFCLGTGDLTRGMGFMAREGKRLEVRVESWTEIMAVVGKITVVGDESVTGCCEGEGGMVGRTETCCSDRDWDVSETSERSRGRKPGCTISLLLLQT